MAQWTQDESWYNSEILYIFSSSEILVRFIDYGNADFTTLTDLIPAGSSLGIVPGRNSTISPSPSRKNSNTEELSMAWQELSPKSMKRVSFALVEKKKDARYVGVCDALFRCLNFRVIFW